MSRVKAVLVLGSLSAFGPLSLDLYLPALPHLADDLGVSDAAAQVTLSASMIGLAVGQLIAGPLSDRIGRRIPLTVGVAVFALMSVACAFAPNLALLTVFRFIQGLGGAAGMVVSRAIVRDLYSGAELARMFSLLMLVSGVMPVAAPMVGGWLSLIMDWRGIFLVLAGIGAALFLCALFLLVETLPPARRQHGLRALGAHANALRSDRLFVYFCLLMACAGATHFTFIGMSSFVFQDELGLDAQMFGYIFGLKAIALIAGAQLNATLVSRVGPARMLAVGIIGSAISGVFLVLASIYEWGIPTIVLGVCLVMFMMGIANPNITALALEHHGDRAGLASALLGLVQFLTAAIVGPAVSGIGVTVVVMSSTMAIASGIGVLVLCGLILPTMRRAVPR